MITTSEDTIKTLSDCVDDLAEPHASIIKDYLASGLKYTTAMRTKYKMKDYTYKGKHVDRLENTVSEALDMLKERLLDRGIDSVECLPHFE